MGLGFDLDGCHERGSVAEFLQEQGGGSRAGAMMASLQ